MFLTVLKNWFKTPATQHETIQANDLALYHFGFCPYCRMVRSKMKQLALDIELRDIHQQDSHFQALLSGGGKQTVPCLRITDAEGQDQWMYESADIMDYLDKRFPRG